MKPDRTTYFFSVPHPVYGTFAPIKMATEYPLGENETEEQAWDEAKRRAEAWARVNFPGLVLEDSHNEVSPLSSEPIIRSKQPPAERISLLIADICSCEDVKILESYRIMAKGHPDLQAAYDRQLNKLSEK